jgi:hypothetical protein
MEFMAFTLFRRADFSQPVQSRRHNGGGTGTPHACYTWKLVPLISTLIQLRMKSTCVFLGLAASLFAQTGDFTTGQAARMVIGQSTFTSQDPNSSDVILGGVSGVAIANDTLFITDSNRVGAQPSNHRVLVYKGVSSMFPSPTAEIPNNRKCPVCLGQATLVLGQPDFTTVAERIEASTNGLRLPTAVATDGVHVVVADTITTGS